MRRKNSTAKFMLCVNNKNYQASLELRKIYQTIPDASATAHRLVRIIDESGEDYLYPKNYFVPLQLPSAIKKVLARA
jgi:hypothetical protein